MTRPLRAWIAFALCFLLGLLAMGWISREVVRLDRSEREAREQAAVEESVRLALWRMDSALTALVAQESSRPPSFYLSARESGATKGEGSRSEPPPAEGTPYVLIHFQLEDDGRLSSPQVPGKRLAAGGERLADDRKSTTGAAEPGAFPERLSRLRSLLSADSLWGTITLDEQTVQMGEQVTDVQEPADQQVAQQASSWQRQSLLNSQERRARAGNYQELNRMAQAQNGSEVSVPGGAVRVGWMKPVWFGEALVLARRVSVSGRSVIQGLWLDWPGVKSWLLPMISDLLPRADLSPAGPEPGDRETRRLAALPALLVPGPIASATSPPVVGWSPLAITLAIAWACVLLGAGAAAVLLRGVMALSERRGAFVSAVTHELRTPLTTFRMYTEMLSGGMVLEEEKRRSYLTTLAREAERLGHLVQNVLAYSRLERGRPGGALETVAIGDALARVARHLGERAEQAGMTLVIDDDPGTQAAKVRADISAVDQVLFNLVDNAC